jgi:hypothetical protein
MLALKRGGSAVRLLEIGYGVIAGIPALQQEKAEYTELR